MYRRVFFLHVDKKTETPLPAAFEDFDLSCDWNKFSTPKISRDLIAKEYRSKTKEYKNSEVFFICNLNVGFVEALNQEVSHNPKQFLPQVKGNPNNRSHTLILGNKSDMTDKGMVKIRALLAKGSSWEIFESSEYKALKQKLSKK